MGGGEGAQPLTAAGVLVLPTLRCCVGPWGQSQDKPGGALLPKKATASGEDAILRAQV